MRPAPQPTPKTPWLNREPASGKPLQPVPSATVAEVREAIARAREAQVRWQALGFRERRRRLSAFGRILADRGDEVCEALRRETGKPPFEAWVHEVFPVVSFAGHFARRAQRVLGERRVPLGLFGLLKRSTVRYDPRGVIGIVSPWNFPFFLPMAQVVMALAAGNAVVVKPSEWTPRVLLLAKELLEAAGIEGDLFAVLPGGGGVGRALIEEGVDFLAFTGSERVGREVAAACGARLIPCVLELGGKDAALVLPGADVRRAARIVAYGAFSNAGQVCAGVERVLAHESISQAFGDAVVEEARRLRQGDAGEAEVDVGPMVMPAQASVVEAQLREAVEGGAEILVGGEVWGEGDVRYVQPTVVAGVEEGMSLWREETFGPCLAVRTFTDVEAAIAEVNRSAFGLNAYVFAGDRRLARRIARRLDVGSALIDDVLYAAALPQLPWGGTKASGVGRTHGDQGLRELCEVRHVGEPALPLPAPWMFPYRDAWTRWAAAAVRLWSRLP